MLTASVHTKLYRLRFIISITAAEAVEPVVVGIYRCLFAQTMIENGDAIQIGSFIGVTCIYNYMYIAQYLGSIILVYLFPLFFCARF